MTYNTTNTSGKYSSYLGYKKVKVTTEWKPVQIITGGKKNMVWLHPWTNESRWFSEQPLPTTHYRWESVAPMATNVHPHPMHTKKTVTENEPNKFKR